MTKNNDGDDSDARCAMDVSCVRNRFRKIGDREGVDGGVLMVGEIEQALATLEAAAAADLLPYKQRFATLARRTKNQANANAFDSTRAKEKRIRLAVESAEAEGALGLLLPSGSRIANWVVLALEPCEVSRLRACCVSLGLPSSNVAVALARARSLFYQIRREARPDSLVRLARVNPKSAEVQAWCLTRLSKLHGVYYEHGSDIRVKLNGNPAFGPPDAALGAWARTAEMVQFRRYQANDFIECPLFFGGEEEDLGLGGWFNVERRLERWPVAATQIRLFHECDPRQTPFKTRGVSVQRFVFPLLGEQWLRLRYAKVTHTVDPTALRTSFHYIELPNNVNDGCTTYLDLARPESGALVTKPMPFELCGL